MDNQFDHIEDSIRNAFEGFELPVNDLDWTAISNGLEASAPKKRGFIGWWNTHNKRNWFIASLLVLLISGSFYKAWKPSDKTVKQEITQTDKKSRNALQGDLSKTGNHTLKNESQNNYSPIDQNSESGKAPAVTGQEKTVINAGNRKDGANANQTGNSAGSGDITPIKPDKKEVLPANKEVVVKKEEDVKPDNSNAENVKVAEPSEIINPEAADVAVDKTFGLQKFGMLKPMGIRIHPSIQPTFTTTAVLNIMPRKFHLGWEWFGSLQTNFDNSKVNATAGSSLWNGVKMQDHRNGQLNMRLEAGLTYRLPGWSLGAGLGFETGAYSGKKDDTIYVKVVTRSLLYKTLQGDSFWLVMKSHDSMIILKHAPVRQWIEVPLYFTKRFYLGNNVRFNAGISLNPGFLAGASGSIANPYAFAQELTMAPYQNGDPMMQPKTAAAKDYLNHFRMGNGIQLGMEKQAGAMNFGLQLNTRYYYTPVWKTGVPLQQHTFNYGINIRIGVEF